MINIFFIKNLFLLFLIFLIQITICNQIILFEKYIPLIYIIWIYVYAAHINKYQFLILSFLLGLCIDILFSTKGIHASACLLISVIRAPVIKIIINYHDNISENLINNLSWIQKIFLIIIMISVHHFWFYTIEFFNYHSLSLILNHTFYNSLTTIIVSIIWVFILH